jgi:hypothetical protein
MKELLKSKTFWTGVTGILTAVGGLCTGTMDFNTALPVIITSLSAIFLKHGQIKG